jgi:hypothetical protein
MHLLFLLSRGEIYQKATENTSGCGKPEIKRIAIALQDIFWQSLEASFPFSYPYAGKSGRGRKARESGQFLGGIFLS